MGFTPEQGQQFKANCERGKRKPAGLVSSSADDDFIAAMKAERLKPLDIHIFGQVRGGKNNITVTRSGKRYPNKSWAKWRDIAVSQVRQQWHSPMFTGPVNVRLEYFAGDKRKRDMPAIIDAIFHVLEKSGVVEDDCLLWVAESSRGYDKKNPRAIITFL